MFKKLLTPVLLILSLFSNAQESQSIIAAKWKDGIYPWFHNNNSHNWTSKPEFEETDKAEIKFTKNAKGEVTEIVLNGKNYLTDNPEVSSYARYFRTTTDSGRCLFFTGDCIMIYVMGKDENPDNMRYVASVGKAGSKKGYSEFVAHLEKSRGIVKEEVAEFKETKSNNTIIGKHQDIKKIEAVVITKDGKELKSGDKFSLGFITTFKDDKVIKTKNIGGLHDIKEYTFSISFPIERNQNTYDVGTPLSDSIAPYCDYLNGEKIIARIYTTGDRNNNSTFISEATIEFNNCTPDPSPKVTLYRKVAEKYDALRLVHGNGDGDQVCYLEKKEPYGFLRQTNDNSKYFKFEEMKENDCFVVATKDSKYYLLTLDGKLKSEQAYEDFSAITDGRIDAKINDIQLYQVKKNGKYGILNYELEEILPFEYDDILPAGTKNIIVVKDGKKGLMNLENLKKPSVYYDLLEGSENFTQFRVRLNGKYGYLNEQGEILIPVEYDYLGHDLYGIFPAHFKGKYYFMDINKQIYFEGDYQYTGDFSGKKVNLKGGGYKFEAYAKVTDNDGVKKYIDKSGNVVDEEYVQSLDDNTNSDSDSHSDSDTDSGSSNSTSNNSSSSSSTSSNSGSDEKGFSGNVYFKYDMSGQDRPGEKLYIHSGSNSSSITSTTPGSKATVKCEKGKVYYSFTGKKSDMKEFMELSEDDCGKTFNYTDFK